MRDDARGREVKKIVAAICNALLVLAAAPLARAQDAAGAKPAEAAAPDAAVTELTRPASYIELGAGYVNRGSFKFGEYNGLEKQGAYGVGNFDLRGGDDYDSDSAKRWRITGSNLGLDVRNISGEYGEQGKYRLNFGYDELRRFYSDTYQTPYTGAGSTNLTLPGFPARNNNIQTPANANYINSNMTNFNLDTKRTKYDLGVSTLFASDWEFKINGRHEEKEGNKLTGVAMGGVRGALLPEPVQYSTDQLDANVSYARENRYFKFGYYGSIFRNYLNAWSAQNPFAGGLATASMGSAPDNQFHQLNAGGGYSFSRTTRLTANLSYGRMTQNEGFQPTEAAGLPATLPQSSLDGLVVTKAANLKLTTKATKDLGLSAAYKYDDHDNHTAVNTYTFTDADGTGAALARTNTPYSKKLQQLNLDADYALGGNKWLKGGYERQSIERWCNGSAVTCVDTTKTKEDTYSAEFRNSVSETVTGRVGYARSQRRAYDYNQDNNIYALYPGLLSNYPASLFGSPTGASLTGSADVLGLRKFMYADRNRDKLRSSANYQATDALSLQGGVDFNQDKYTNSPYGLQDSKSWALNLDATYAMSENLSANVFYTYEEISSQSDGRAWNNPGAGVKTVPGTCSTVTGTAQPTDAKTDPCRNFEVNQKDVVHTLGTGMRYKGLMSGKLDLNGDIVYAHDRSPIGVTGGTYFSNGTNLVFIPAQDLPDVTSSTIDLRLGGRYALDKTASMRVTYIFRRLKSSDWQYDSYTTPTTIQGYIGPMITSPNYNVQVIGLSYIKNF